MVVSAWAYIKTWQMRLVKDSKWTLVPQVRFEVFSLRYWLRYLSYDLLCIYPQRRLIDKHVLEEKLVQHLDQFLVSDKHLWAGNLGQLLHVWTPEILWGLTLEVGVIWYARVPLQANLICNRGLNHLDCKHEGRSRLPWGLRVQKIGDALHEFAKLKSSVFYLFNDFPFNGCYYYESLDERDYRLEHKVVV